MKNDTEVVILSRVYWFKVVDMLQHNWALIDELGEGQGVKVFFFGDTSGVFDYMQFASKSEAEVALRRNGFAKYSEDKQAQNFITQPEPPFYEKTHPNGPIYSSGKFWR